MITIGLTGGIGSGKTTVAKEFEKLHIPVFDSDIRAKDLYVTNSVLREQMIQEFGEEVYIGSHINRPYLANIVFNNQERLEKLNSLVHPLLQMEFETWRLDQDAPYVIREAAILVESGGYQFCDKVIVVNAPVEVRIQRVVQRDETTKEAVKSRMSKQMDSSELLTYADFVIENDGKNSLPELVKEIHFEIISKL